MDRLAVGMECWVWPWRANEDYSWWHNSTAGRVRNFSYGFAFLDHRWVSGHLTAKTG